MMTRATIKRLLPVAPATVPVTVTPVVLVPGNPTRLRVGSLTYLGGWAVKGAWPGDVGGLSAMRIAPDGTVDAISDAGAHLRFRIGRFGRIGSVAVTPIPSACQVPQDGRDAEGLAIDPATGTRWITLEDTNRLCRIDRDGRVASAILPDMARWSKAGGAETLLRFPDGRFLIVAERARRDGTHVALLYPRDPLAGDAPVRFAIRPPQGFRPTDAAMLPDGRVVMVVRAFSPLRLFTAAVVAVDPLRFAAGTTVETRELARLAPPVIAENFEAIAVTREDGRAIVWIASDDNFMAWQRTLILKFAIAP